MFLSLLGLCVAGFYYQHRRERWVRSLSDQARTAETQLELAVVARVVRDFRIEQGRYPQDLKFYLSRTLRQNKPFPPGTDFWGRDYRLEPGVEGFLVRSAGADGRFHTRDDLVCRATVPE